MVTSSRLTLLEVPAALSKKLSGRLPTLCLSTIRFEERYSRVSSSRLIMIEYANAPPPFN